MHWTSPSLVVVTTKPSSKMWGMLMMVLVSAVDVPAFVWGVEPGVEPQRMTAADLPLEDAAIYVLESCSAATIARADTSKFGSPRVFPFVEPHDWNGTVVDLDDFDATQLTGKFALVVKTTDVRRRLNEESDDDPSGVRMTPNILAGILVGLLFAFCVFVGLTCLGGIQTPSQFALTGPPSLKEW